MGLLLLQLVQGEVAKYLQVYPTGQVFGVGRVQPIAPIGQILFNVFAGQANPVHWGVLPVGIYP